MLILLVNFQKHIYRWNNWKMYMCSTQFKDFPIEKFCHISVLGFLWVFFVLVLYFEFFIFSLSFLHLVSQWKVITEVIDRVLSKLEFIHVVLIERLGFRS